MLEIGALPIGIAPRSSEGRLFSRLSLILNHEGTGGKTDRDEKTCKRRGRTGPLVVVVGGQGAGVWRGGRGSPPSAHLAPATVREGALQGDGGPWGRRMAFDEVIALDMLTSNLAVRVSAVKKGINQSMIEISAREHDVFCTHLGIRDAR